MRSATFAVLSLNRDIDRMSRLRFLLPLVTVSVLLFLGWLWLRHYTRHGTVSSVPDLRGLSFADAEAILAERDMLALVIDSVHTEDAPKGGVVDQDPRPGAEVKPQRKVYLVLNAQQPQMIDMPALVDLSKRQALSVLEILGLKVHELQYKPDPCVDCVIDQLIDGQPAPPGTRIRRGRSVTLVLGSGERGERVPVPDLRGLTNAEVALVLNMASLNLGLVVSCEGCNTASDSTLARVQRQSPAADRNDRIALGSTIDIWLTADTAGLLPASGWNDPARYMSNDTIDVEP